MRIAEISLSTLLAHQEDPYGAITDGKLNAEAKEKNQLPQKHSRLTYYDIIT